MFKTTEDRTIDIEEINWDSASKLLQNLHPNLVKVINNVSPDTSLTLYKASYPFATPVINRGNIQLPLAEGGTISVNSDSLPPQLANDLHYGNNNRTPLGVLLNRNAEFYLPIGDRIMPYEVLSPGNMFGLAKIVDSVINRRRQHSNSSPFIWNLNAGARSIFMLSKISNAVNHRKLKKVHNLSLNQPDGYPEHCLVFEDILKNGSSQWRLEVLYFSNKWLDKLSDPAWSLVYNELLNIHRSSYKMWHNEILIWHTAFNLIEQSSNLSVFMPYALATARHLFVIAANSAPGFRPATDELSAPILTLQEAYIKNYELTNQPVIMEPAQFVGGSNLPVYYSLNYPTLAESNAKILRSHSNIRVLEQIQCVVKKYQEGILANCENSPASLYHAASTVQFSYYHNDPTDYKQISNSALLFDKDSRFSHGKKNDFPFSGAFINGCIKISPNVVE
ncbi:MAG: hypothetical protein KBD37_03160 [Burkholderiales bacterium]|nr:hypothetical protein [Burkholderiales bacterium]